MYIDCPVRSNTLRNLRHTQIVRIFFLRSYPRALEKKVHDKHGVLFLFGPAGGRGGVSYINIKLYAEQEMVNIQSLPHKRLAIYVEPDIGYIFQPLDGRILHLRLNRHNYDGKERVFF